MRLLVAGLAICVLSTSAGAQVDPMPYVQIQAANIQYGEMLKRNLGTSARPRRNANSKGTAGASGGSTSGTTPFENPARTDAAPVSFTYQSTAALRRTAANDYVARVAKSDSGAAQTIAAEFAKHDFARIYAGLVAPVGYRPNDAADVLAAYTLLGWLIANGVPDATPRQAAAVRSQIAQRVGGDPNFTNPSARARFGEDMKLLVVTLHAGWQSARREGNLKQYGDGVAALFQRNDIDLRALRLTDAGFVGR